MKIQFSEGECSIQYEGMGETIMVMRRREGKDLEIMYFDWKEFKAVTNELFQAIDNHNIQYLTAKKNFV